MVFNRKTGYYQLEKRCRDCGKVKYRHIAYLGAKPAEKLQSFIDSGRFTKEEVSSISYKAEDFSLEGRVLKIFLSNLRKNSHSPDDKNNEHGTDNPFMVISRC